ncbi:hypothetical protein FCR2A7T_08840 [Flavobacterium cauense R2A-7]|nr:hypothetical protein FCR2A7T_08840 [Flavobacterium cauense R2A-7]
MNTVFMLFYFNRTNLHQKNHTLQKRMPNCYFLRMNCFFERD